MESRLEEIIDSSLAHAYAMFEKHPEMKKWLRDMSFAVCSELSGVDPSHNLFPRLLAEKGIKCFEDNFSLIAEQVKTFDSSFQVACSTGCSYCCFSHITLMPQEAFNIALHLAQTCTEEDFTTLTQGCVLGASGFESGKPAEFAKKYFRPCPFLRSGKCSIYKVRPIVCRNWISSDLNACIASHRSKDKVSVPQNALIMIQKDLIFAGQKAYLSGQGINGSIASFLPLMEEILTDFEEAYAKWTTGGTLQGQILE
ncbi:YkgJ family cysteine cluster protein [Maridesulfovibrio hydrothermalis]|uniref:Zinc-or iron-chelating domain-containing protein n=1 Tax=Maridesulfovibrio hydrothermalis AM13 = DSM 14728 TaxID=1121451 RepID=L0RBX4_9BACT|nr:YkgJ family cysteine cluster protein [Maridesulfovibrio hydrothermalis]CCO23690.1 conserved protein of unknown function [Maridesulfovibrio hydrothermalis AM13 = DSM 14728]